MRYRQYHGLTADSIRDLAASSHRQGYVLSEGLFHDGITSIGIPIFNGNKEVIAAITVSCISQRMTEKHRREIVQLVNKVINREGIIGFKPRERRT
jgi:DNA-binding IclR family transcriptional regulator